MSRFVFLAVVGSLLLDDQLVRAESLAPGRLMPHAEMTIRDKRESRRPCPRGMGDKANITLWDNQVEKSKNDGARGTVPSVTVR
jgi:hypothetical protein